MSRVRFGALLAVGVAALAGLAAAGFERVTVTGGSMLPTVRAGERLLVRRRPGVRAGRPVPGTLLVVSDPRVPERRVVKRLVAATAGGAVVRGDNPAASTDSRVWGPVPWPLVHGTVLYRYFPPERAGRVR